MPTSIYDPFLIAKNSSYAALKANRLLYDLPFLRAYYVDSEVVLNDCEIATATYLAWHESLKSSGVRFEEHVDKLGIPNCKIDQSLVKKFFAQKEEALINKANYYIEEDKKTKMWVVGGLGVGFFGLGIAFIFNRRKSKKAE